MSLELIPTLDGDSLQSCCNGLVLLVCKFVHVLEPWKKYFGPGSASALAHGHICKILKLTITVFS
ncbi:hypothetical protein TSUD_322510 [Trifolium subterraneum]|uniref:Uncharacterized protein n=1 Tax=Trifolium subterraneum TaxID=3900 RepID=A0A2Z6N190_TRISU|nr:hypothetical protein TSUD_322510 [Trifolium subterraneum]